MIEKQKTHIAKLDRTQPGSNPQLSPIDALAEEFLSRLRGGESPEIEEYTANHPELAEEIRELFPTLAMLEKYGCKEPEPEPPKALAAFEDVPDRLGEYQIRGEIGRGGMGIVYDAVHRTMQRRVALKVLPREKVSKGKNLERFLRETRAAGNLHHTNIVPVFEVGLDQGVYFYSMQYIHGQNLDAVIEELRRHHEVGDLAGNPSAATMVSQGEDRPARDQTVAEHLLSGRWENSREEGTTKLVDSSSVPLEPLPEEEKTKVAAAKADALGRMEVPDSSEFAKIGETGEGYFRRVARVGLQVAEALDYAHHQGVLHRDIKPSNLLLDLKGVVWVTDFGLAKHEGDDFTHTGDIVGTLRYMAPERFRGQTDARSDLYSLGLTLYELCTFRHAHEQSGRAQLIHHVTHEAPPPPRAVNPRVPRDLETIILKTIDKDPNHRYQTAGDLAEDLRLFVHDHPIKARRASLRERTWRWCRRNPSQAFLTASVALLLLVLAGVSLYSAYDSSRHAEQLKAETLRALGAEKKAQEATRVATKALYETHVGRAQAGRWSQRPGQHFSSLAALNEAARILPTLGLTKAEMKAEKLKLKNEAIAAMPLVDVRVKHSWPVEKGWTGMVAFTADFEAYAHSDVRGNLTIRRVADDQELHFFTGPGDRAWLLQFSPDGRFLAGKFHGEGTPAVVWVWELESGRIVLECDEKTFVPSTMSFSPDGTRFAIAGADHVIRFYSLPESALLFEKESIAVLNEFCFNPAGTQIALATEQGGYVLDLPQAGADGPAKEAGEESPGPIAFQPAEPLNSIAWNGDYISAGTPRGMIRVWETQNPKDPIHVLEGHLARVVQLNASHSGNLLFSRSWDGTSRLWDLQRGREVLRIDVQSPIRSAFSPDDRLIGFSGSGSTFGIWEVSLGGPLRSVGKITGNHTRWMTQIHPKFPDLVATATNQGAQIWNIETGKLVGIVPSEFTHAVLIPPDGASVITSGPMGLCQWPLEIDAEQLDEIQIGPRKVLLSGRTGRASMDDAGRYVAVDHGYRHAAVIDLEDPANRTVLSPHSEIDRAVLSPDGRLVVTSTWQGHGVRVWDRKTGTMLENLMPEVGSATPAFSPDGNWLAVATGETHFLYDARTWRCRQRIPRERPDGWPGDVTFSPDGKLVAFTYTRYSAQLLDVSSGERVAILEPPDRRTLGWMTFSQDGRRLMIAEDDHFQIWNWQAVTDQLKAMNLD